MNTKGLFSTKEERDIVSANFRQLKDFAGWQLIVTMLSNDIEVLTMEILAGGGTEAVMDEKRKQLRLYQTVVDLPDYYIKKFQEPAPFVENSDPFHTIESLRRSRK